jgi:glycosyltransferase involved in cell wall biosynthesis
LAICENAPSVDPVGGTGSTLISAHVLAALPTDIALTVAYFPDLGDVVDPRVVQRADRIIELPILSLTLGKAAQPFTALPSASWIRNRTDARRAVRRLSAEADVTYLHGPHTFALAAAVRGPIVANGVDPYADHFRQLAETHPGPKALYWRLQARRFERIQQSIADRAERLVLVSPADAERVARDLGVPVTAIPNGVPAPDGPRRREDVDDRVVVFGGSLAYPPNVEAAERLARDVMPLVWTEVPDCRLVLTGRRPSPRVTILASDRIDIRADVDALSDQFRSAALSCYPGTMGLGSKNCVRESLAVGCPVVCTPESARDFPEPDALTLGRSDQDLATHIVRLLRDDERREDLGERGRRAVEQQPTWPVVAERFALMFRDAAGVSA